MEMVRKLIVIYGCHGAGKSTLARTILGENFTECSNEYGKYTLSQDKSVVAVGKYSIKCGGADSLKGTEYYYKMLYWLINEFPNSTIVIEGIFLSALFKRPLEEFLRIKYDYGVEVLQVFLYADLKTSYERVLGRNGREPKLNNIKAKVNSVKNNIIKFRNIHEFPNVVINTVGKTKEDVYNEFVQFMKAYK
jgi:adenylate kinase family enzyme